MASYSNAYPVAFHVVPLFALKGVWDREALLAGGAATAARPTTSRIDRALCFDGFVHFYLATGLERLFELPILGAQLGAAKRPPFPHGVLVLPTAQLTDAESLICNWNSAVSRPGTPRVKGGIWTRGTKPEPIGEVWDEFRSLAPSAERARGYFNMPYRIPTLLGTQIAANLSMLKRAPGGMPELLLRPPVPLSRFSCLCLFSRRDVSSVRHLGPLPVPLAEYGFPGYTGDLVPAETRRRIDAYFAAPHRVPAPDFEFDRVRPRN